MSPPQQSAMRNRLLAALEPQDFARLAPVLEPVTLPLHAVLIPGRQAATAAYFVEQGMVALIADSNEGRIEVGLVGREGLLGIPLILGADRTPHSAVVQVPGTALRVAAGDFRAALEASTSLRRVLGRYVQSRIVQVGQTVYANAVLNLEARLARWILMTHDRLDGDELPFTHESLSLMLAVRRPGVTTAIHGLEGMGMIRARRGRIVVLDRERLADLAGDSYGVAEAEYERLIAKS